MNSCARIFLSRSRSHWFLSRSWLRGVSARVGAARASRVASARLLRHRRRPQPDGHRRTHQRLHRTDVDRFGRRLRSQRCRAAPSTTVPSSAASIPKRGRGNSPANSCRIRFGKNGGLTEIRYCGFGFTHVRREVFEAVREKLALPVCNQRFASLLVPYLEPMSIPEGDGRWSGKRLNYG